jgi:hypothetical protein
VAGVRGFVSAWAERAGGGERIWYFSADTFAPQVDAVPTATATTRAIKIGPDHAPGTYVVKVRVTKQPMGRDSLLHLPATSALVETQSLLTVTLP